MHDFLGSPFELTKIQSKPCLTENMKSLPFACQTGVAFRFAQANLPISVCDLAKVVPLVGEFYDLLKMVESSPMSSFNSNPFISDLQAGLLHSLDCYSETC